MGASLSLTLRPHDDHGRLTAAVADFTRSAALSKRASHTLGVILEEVVTNVINHGAGPRGATIKVAVNRAGPHLTATIRDDAAPFDPLKHPKVDTTLPLEERQIGGLGIHFMRAMTDDLTYRRERGENVLSFSLDLSQG
ncbi:MAG: ATP-binding protein [Pseudomonadota bacterium]